MDKNFTIEDFNKEIKKVLSDPEIEWLMTEGYQSWIKNLIELKKENPEQFEKVFRFREHSYLQDTIIEQIFLIK